MTEKTKERGHGSLAGLGICIVIGFLFDLLLTNIHGSNAALDYTNFVSGITQSVPREIAWLFMNFTEPYFYANVFAGIGIIVGGFIAYALAMKNSRYAGFDICYGSSSLFPWVVGSELLSAGLAIFVYRYIDLFNVEGTTWVATFITIAGAPPAVMLMYGPSLSAFLTVSILGGLIACPTATFFSQYLIGPWELPGVIANVLAMTVTGFILCMIMKLCPFVRKAPIVDHRKGLPAKKEDVHSTKWFIRRVIADFSEAPFYENEIASIGMLVGLVIGCCVCGTHTAYGAGPAAVGAIVLSQFVSSAVGVFLYADKFDNGEWYATYVPVVSVGPACVLMFGSTVPVALFAGILGGIMGGPVAEFFGTRLPEGVHGTVANVTSMAVCTAIVAVTMKYLPCF